MSERILPKPDIVLFLVAREDGKIMVEERTEIQNDYYGKKLIPSGKVKEGENSLDALRRELFEELGIEAQITIDLGNFYLETGRLAKAFLITKYEGQAINKEGRNIQHWLLPYQADAALELASGKLVMERARRFIPKPTAT